MLTPDQILKEWELTLYTMRSAPRLFRTLIEELAYSDAAVRVWPRRGHDIVSFVSGEENDVSGSLQTGLPLLCVWYYSEWPERGRFLLRFWNFQGVPYDQKWCQLPEAVATLKYAFNRLTPEGE